jgi:hypothetical protein
MENRDQILIHSPFLQNSKKLGQHFPLEFFIKSDFYSIINFCKAFIEIVLIKNLKSYFNYQLIKILATVNFLDGSRNQR